MLSRTWLGTNDGDFLDDRDDRAGLVRYQHIGVDTRKAGRRTGIQRGGLRCLVEKGNAQLFGSHGFNAAYRERTNAFDDRSHDPLPSSPGSLAVTLPRRSTSSLMRIVSGSMAGLGR